MKIIKSIFFVLITLLSFYASCFAECTNFKGLYEERISLKEKKNLLWNQLKPWKNNFKENGYLQVKKELEDIDSKYARVINEMFLQFNGGEDKLFYQCCNDAVKDRIIFFVCNLIRYKRNNNADHFLKNIPSNGNGLLPLWAIDDIVMGQKSSEFRNATFVQAFFKEIYHIATRDNSVAMERLFQIARYTDGWYAEEMQELILKLIKEHPLVIMNNFDIANKYKSTISLETTNYASEADEIIQNYKNSCARAGMFPSICEKIIIFLNEMKGKDNSTVSNNSNR